MKTGHVIYQTYLSKLLVYTRDMNDWFISSRYPEGKVYTCSQCPRPRPLAQPGSARTSPAKAVKVSAKETDGNTSTKSYRINLKRNNLETRIGFF